MSKVLVTYYGLAPHHRASQLHDKSIGSLNGGPFLFLAKELKIKEGFPDSY